MEDKINKPIKAKPHFYSACLHGMQEIARDHGYNLVIHGSMNRDMDLVCIAWVNNPKSHKELLKCFCEYLGVLYLTDQEDNPLHFQILPGNRSSYVINLDRGSKFNGYVDGEYYLDICFTPF